ncbi:atp synthase delta subunit protein [Cystoisospora suis]|uniref:Atp synthase delta subunit protein n=1 Tax=Cystoisospora suis TaxID=483139 RepID=A0A2C6LBN0_9APIC|nr:atp synthase delta subunit protein [Cystoisospora suis]
MAVASFRVASFLRTCRGLPRLPGTGVRAGCAPSTIFRLSLLSPSSSTSPSCISAFSSTSRSAVGPCTFCRCFSSAAGASQEPTMAPKTLEGRYAYALFRVAKKKNALDKVYEDLEAVRSGLESSSEFRLFVETPAVSSHQKLDVLNQLTVRYKLDALTGNLLTTLLENKRLPLLAKVVEAFDELYRKEKGELKCVVTSAAPLSPQQQSEVLAALKKRAGGQAKKLLVDYVVNPQLMGGLVVRLGEQVLDFSVASRLERLQAQLLAPL